MGTPTARHPNSPKPLASTSRTNTIPFNSSRDLPFISYKHPSSFTRGFIRNSPMPQAIKKNSTLPIIQRRLLAPQLQELKNHNARPFQTFSGNTMEIHSFEWETLRGGPRIQLHHKNTGQNQTGASVYHQNDWMEQVWATHHGKNGYFQKSLSKANMVKHRQWTGFCLGFQIQLQGSLSTRFTILILQHKTKTTSSFRWNIQKRNAYS